MVELRRLRPPMRRVEYFAPQSLAEAIALFGEKGEGGRALAGGTDLVPQIKEGGKIPMPAYVVSLRHLPELRGIEFSERAGMRIGAGVTMAELAESPVLRGRHRLHRRPLRRHCARPPRLRGAGRDRRAGRGAGAAAGGVLAGPQRDRAPPGRGAAGAGGGRAGAPRGRGWSPNS